MLVVKNIEVIEVDTNMLRVVHQEEYDMAEETVNITTEMIRGEHFTNARGERFCIGMSKQVEEAIGLPMKIFTNMSSEMETQRITIAQLRQRYATALAKIDKFKSMKLWGRIKNVFTTQVVFREDQDEV